MAGFVVVAARSEADSGEGGGGADAHNDSKVGAVVRGGKDRGGGPAQAGRSEDDASPGLDGGAGG